jgi:peptidoglycan hydrolase-like protein with peptidoglycan-binding domain
VGRGGGYGSYQWLAPGRRTLRLMDAGDDVKYVQRRIGSEPDGYLGAETAEALRRFREAQGMPADAPALVGRDLWALLLGATGAQGPAPASAPQTRRRWRLGGDATLTRR